MKHLLLSIVSLSLIFSCSSAKKDKLELEAKVEQNKVTDAKALGGTIQELIQSSKTLNQDQKKQIENIMDENRKLATELTEKSYQLRAVLIEELLSGKSTKRRIRILEKDIKKVEADRLNNTFQTVKKISSIVSGDPENKQYTKHLINLNRDAR